MRLAVVALLALYPMGMIRAWSAPTAAFTKDDPRIVVALLQMSSFGYDQTANLRKADAWCREAAEAGADIALMPEMWNIGYTRFDPEDPAEPERFWARAAETRGPWVQHFAKLARELQMAIGVTYEQAWSPRPRNAITLFDRQGKEAFTYAKVHTSDFKPLEANMTPGDAFHVAEVNTAKGPVKVGAMICFDREQPESARILMLKGAELILTPNCCGLEDIRLQQFRIRAFENVLCVAMANYPEPYKNGHSVAYDDAGNTVVMASEREGIVYAAFDMEATRKRRGRVIWGNAYRRPHRYGALTAQDKDEVWRRIDGNGHSYSSKDR